MVSFLRWVIAIPLIVAVVGFSIMHRNPLTVTWSPVHPTFDVPTYSLLLVGLALGFLLGSLMTWVFTADIRRQKNNHKKTIKVLEKEIGNINEKRFNEKQEI